MESLVHYSNPSHALSVLAVLNEQRLRGQMCDVVLVVADQRYQAHQSVLAASSEYFQSLFAQMDKETLKVVNLDFCEPDSFETVLNYIYTSSLFIDKGSLAAIQELGYSLGIPFLTNIVSTRPHASYCVSRKRLSFCEGEENDIQTRSVIVYRVPNDAAHGPRCVDPKKSELSPSSPNYTRELAQSQSDHGSSQLVKHSGSMYRSSPEDTETVESKSAYSYASILKGGSSKMTPVRPQLTSSVSFSEAEVEHNQLQSNAQADRRKENGEEAPYQTKVPVQGQASNSSHHIDRSGPLIKSLLRRSLSMDSPVPVFSPTLELRELRGREQSVVKLASKAAVPEASAHKDGAKTSPLMLRSKYQGRCDEESQVESQVSIKAEPSSPLADPMDIVRITVGETLPVSLRDLQANYDQGSRPQGTPPGKRYHRPMNRRYPLKKSKLNKEQPPSSPHSVGSERGAEPENRIFKCWNCSKVFRSSAGLHRHVNMYHNPEKPYACDICHKRFHTNFKVWTHCQTQHGVVQNPASSASSAAFDDKFQKKLLDIVREREIKKALLWKLKRNKHGLQSPALAKKRNRPSFICPYCGKAFVFHSHYRQHLRSHPAENTHQDMEIVRQKDPGEDVYSCRLCNVKLSSLFEQGDHERGCWHSTVCPYCGLRFSTPAVKKDHEAHCKYKKLTCLECMRSFKSSFSIWRHQVEVHNQNIMTAKEQLHLRRQEGDAVAENVKDKFFGDGPLTTGSSRQDSYGDSTGPPTYESNKSPCFVPEDLSTGRLLVKEEPMEESVSERENSETASSVLEEPGVWPCEKCGSLFGARKDLERHQELLCHIKPFICHICKKAFRTNFRLWSHFQSHIAAAHEPGPGDFHSQPPPLSPSPPMTLPNAQHPSVLKPSQPAPVAAAAASEEPNSPDTESPGGAQESDTLFYHASSLSALAFKRQYMCKICHRTFKTAFSLWSHEQSHSH
ncbi:unnamed protein product, partial [Tetraodon nigroviridis]